MEQAESKQYKRKFRNVLIHKPMQREFTLVLISLLIVSALAVAFVIHYTIHEAMMGGGYQFGKISPYEVMSEVSYDLITRVSIILFITMLIIAIFGVLFLHRIAGPVYRFQGVLRRISRGEIPEEVRLREGDFFTETATDLNQVIRGFRDTRKVSHDLRVKIEETLRKGALSPTDPALKEIQQLLEKLG